MNNVISSYFYFSHFIIFSIIINYCYSMLYITWQAYL